MIESIFYFQLNENYSEFIFNDYLSIISIINIQQPKKVIIYHHFKNINQCLYYQYLNKIYTQNIFEFIKYECNFINHLLNKLKEKGGIYIKNNILLLKKISQHLLNDCFFLEDYIYGFSENCFILNSFKIKIIINKTFEIFGFKQNICRLEDNIIFNKLNNDDLMNVIIDYNFNHYFDMMNTSIFLKIEIFDKVDYLFNNIKESKITYMNLIIYYILGYPFYYSPKKIERYKINFNSILKGISKIYWLNLNSCTQRKHKMLELFKHTSILNKRIEAYNGKILQDIKNTYFEKSEIYTYNSNSEYAVLLSHLNMLKEAMNDDNLNNDDYILFLEDDVCLDFGSYWNVSIDEIIKNAPNDCELIMLGYFSLNLKFNENYRLWNNDWSAMAYIIKKSVLHKLNSKINKDNKYMLFHDVNVADNYIFRLFKTYVYQYPIFTISDDNTSTFHPDHDHYQKIYKNINYLILNHSLSKYFSINNP